MGWHPALDCFKSYLLNWAHSVVVGDASSSLARLTCGVPQGSILEPLLFCIHYDTGIYINTTFCTIILWITCTLMSHYKPVKELIFINCYLFVCQKIKCWMSKLTPAEWKQIWHRSFWSFKAHPNFIKSPKFLVYKCQTCRQNPQKPVCNIWQWPFFWKTSYKSRSIMLLSMHLVGLILRRPLMLLYQCFFYHLGEII